MTRRGIYDNMKTAVDRTSRKDRNRAVNARFAAMAAHYQFDADFCIAASGWEKGRVEKGVQGTVGASGSMRSSSASAAPPSVLNMLSRVTFPFFSDLGNELLFVDYVPFVSPFGNEVHFIMGFYGKS